MQGRTFTPQHKRKKKSTASNQHRLQHVSLDRASNKSATDNDSNKDSDDAGWSVVTRSTPSRVQQSKAPTSALESLSLSERSTVSSLADLQRRYPSIRHVSVREPLIQHLAGLKTSDLPDSGLTLLDQALQKRGESPAIHKTSSKTSEESLDKLRQRHLERIGPAWRASSARPRLLQSLKRIMHLSSGAGGAQWDCVCLGLGSVSAETTGWKSVSMWQLVIWEDICTELFKNSRLVFQDPMLNDSDKSFLRHLGHEVVGSPSGYDLINSSTHCVVFAPHFPTVYWPRGMRTGRPLFILGNPVADHSSLLAKMPEEDVILQAADLVEAIAIDDKDDENSFNPIAEAELLREDRHAREEMHLFLDSWASFRLEAPQEYRESLFETAVWAREAQPDSD